MIFISVRQAAERLGVSRQRVLRLLAEGRLEGCRLDPRTPGSPWLVDELSVERRRETQAIQRAWSQAGVSRRFLGLANPDEAEDFRCPNCGGVAYAVPVWMPAQYEGRAACSKCEWRSNGPPEANVRQGEAK